MGGQQSERGGQREGFSGSGSSETVSVFVLDYSLSGPSEVVCVNKLTLNINQ